MYHYESEREYQEYLAYYWLEDEQGDDEWYIC